MTNTAFILYEQIHPEGIYAFPDLIHQKNRYKDLGWQSATAADINTVHDKYLDRQEMTRMARLEILDGLEE
ncbi:hypothetical protein INT48_001380 [Thamnidium elegans]|uniref:Uncharacterized protein n=1 Tax=Thamnidium elegans TaxID=101142 RepID=A0A8H7VVS7_9FUNG|nr:hypothetical protein INT48_001380 [Thamnidium elegans]